MAFVFNVKSLLRFCTFLLVILIMAFVSLSLSGCASSEVPKLKGAATILKKLKLEQLPEEGPYEDFGAVILYENTMTEYGFDSDGGTKSNTVEKSILYFNDRANHVLTQSIVLHEGDELASFIARTTNPDGSVEELSVDDLRTTSVDSEFSTVQVMEFTFEGVQPGSLLEYQYQVQIAPSKFRLFSEWWIQDIIPKLYTRYAFLSPEGLYDPRWAKHFQWTYTPVNIQLVKPYRRIEDNVRIYEWVLRDVSAIPLEPKMPPTRDIGQYVLVGIDQFDDWDDLIPYYWDEIKAKLTHNPMVEEKAEGLTSSCRSMRSKIDRVYQHTQNAYRYVSANLEESGTIPNDPELVMQRKYGDCKDMSFLNIAMLKSVGIDAYPALVRVRSQGRHIDSRVNWDFNHMVAYVLGDDGEVYWLDATGNYCPSDVPNPEIAGIKALVITEDGGSFYKEIPRITPAQAAQKRKVSLHLDETGAVQGKCRFQFDGVEMTGLYSFYTEARKDNFESYLIAQFNPELPRLEVTSIEVNPPSALGGSFVVTCDISYDTQSVAGQGLLILSDSVFRSKLPVSQFDAESRMHPLFLSHPYQVSDQIEIHFEGSKYAVESLPEDVAHSYVFGSYSRSYQHGSGDSIIKRREMVMRAQDIDSRFFAPFEKYIEQQRALDQEKLGLAKLF